MTKGTHEEHARAGCLMGIAAEDLSHFLDVNGERFFCSLCTDLAVPIR